MIMIRSGIDHDHDQANDQAPKITRRSMHHTSINGVRKFSLILGLYLYHHFVITRWMHMITYLIIAVKWVIMIILMIKLNTSSLIN